LHTAAALSADERARFAVEGATLRDEDAFNLALGHAHDEIQ
jgi:hypothetical protein